MRNSGRGRSSDLAKIYWDACVWIALIQKESGRSDACEDLITRGKAGELEIWTSTITLAECYKKRCDKGNVGIDAGRETAFEEYLDKDFVRLVQVDKRVGKCARGLLRNHESLKKPNDGIHLASAVVHNIHTFYTYDGDDLIPLDGEIYCRDNGLLKINNPPTPVPGPLFGSQGEAAIEA